ncbi:HlyIII-domain-containing protein [Athelia psychrophila]|uniref:HlyIII-domain-containing protein n=1 Tax=Athelia psychrophila TaxID=1759441 RepID=A0A166F6J0_9AGAM|nr:HlyIII-domain-containing protein [Fibularhizoctonia sp. CBS 109695]
MSTTTATQTGTRPNLKKRRFTTTDSPKRRAGQQLAVICHPLPQSLEALDLSTASAKQTLASLRFLILSYLADLEASLSSFPVDTPVSDFSVAKSLMPTNGGVSDARAWAQDALEMLDQLRTDVRSHLPEFHLADISVESVRAHLPELPDASVALSRLPHMDDVLSHLPEFHLADMSAHLDDVRERFAHLDFQPLHYIPNLCEGLQSLHTHLSSLELPDVSGSNCLLSGLVDALLSSELAEELKEDAEEAEDLLLTAVKEIKNAVQRSLHGAELIQYDDLPQKWRNNKYVNRGYRFIPLNKWPLIIRSVFSLHNEFLNIHTHLIPLVAWSAALLTLPSDPVETAYIFFALVCLFCSVIWHTMTGCAHQKGMDLCARVDYVGIGWLIAASVGTVAHYGFRCYPHIGHIFMSLCLMSGIAGSVFPFMDWFNQRKHKGWRIVFFVSLAFTAVGPLAALAYLHGIEKMHAFAAPVAPSILSYIVGLVFYATHVPERYITGYKFSRWLENVGLTSHAIWHMFIVLAISQHKFAISHMRGGIAC